ncbi:hypothetical protein Q5752_006641 [Cryptotrichosporon argae]
MANQVNAIGAPPSAERVELVARKSLGLDETPDEPTPKFYLPVLKAFLTSNPADTHFLVEFSGDRNVDLGGDGYGAITCMEDACWNDINLGPDSSKPDGGKRVGLGSLVAYRNHCETAIHKKSRNERLAKMGIENPAPAPSSTPSTSFRSSQPSSSARPGSLPSSSKGKGKARATVRVDSDLDDSDIEFLSSGKAGMESKPIEIVEVSDSEDDIEAFMLGPKKAKAEVKPEIKPEASSSSQPRSSQPDTLPAWQRAWNAVSLRDKVATIKRELSQLKTITFSCSLEPPVVRQIIDRTALLSTIIASNGLLAWQPPTKELLKSAPALRQWYEYPLSLALPPAEAKPDLDQFFPPGFLPVSAPGPSAAIQVQPFAPPSLAGPSNLGPSNALADATKRLLEAVRNRTLPLPLLNMSAAVLQRLQQSNVAAQGAPGSHPSLRPGQDVGVGEDGEYEWGYEHDRPRTAHGLQEFFQNSMADFAEDLTVEDAMRKIGLDNINDKVPGATFTLMAHQILGVSFMVEREKAKTIKGGILADAMGLGKTVQTISLMLLRQNRDNGKHGPVLIVCPLALMQQWKTEIETKTTVDWNVCVHHGQGRAKSVQKLKRFHVVITTYHTLASESKSDPKARKKKGYGEKNGESDESDLEIQWKEPGPLLKMKWFRVICDEAHYARNKNTRAAKALCQLDVEHPWALTGTPIVNSLSDLYSQLRFLGAISWDNFRDKVFKFEKTKPKLASKRAMAILKPLIVRRNKDSEINGQRILQLPPKETRIAQLDFTEDERAIYNAVQTRAQIRFNHFLRRGEVIKNYSQILVMLTRLRQLCDHPWLVRRKPGEAPQPNDLRLDMTDDDLFGMDLGNGVVQRNNDEDELVRAVNLIGNEGVDKLHKKLKERYDAANDADDNENVDLDCSICFEPFTIDTESITACGHSFCTGCITNLFDSPLRDGPQILTDDEVGRGCRPCPMCRTALEKGRIFRAAAIYRPPAIEEAEEVEDENEMEVDVKPKLEKGKAVTSNDKKRSRSPGDSKPDIKRVKQDVKPSAPNARASGSNVPIDVEDDDADTVSDDDKQVIRPSSKMKHMAALLEEWLGEDGDTRILVFSQFTAFLDIVSDDLRAKEINFVSFRGDMTQNARNEAVRLFSVPTAVDPDAPRVMLLSTKAGGVGLNLTIANKVICLDLCWSPAMENQAVDRAHRIGQTRPVTVERLVIRDTVEDRLLQIQADKGFIADGALGEGEAGRLGRLGVAELMRLFDVHHERGEE